MIERHCDGNGEGGDCRGKDAGGEGLQGQSELATEARKKKGDR